MHFRNNPEQKSFPHKQMGNNASPHTDATQREKQTLVTSGDHEDAVRGRGNIVVIVFYAKSILEMWLLRSPKDRSRICF